MGITRTPVFAISAAVPYAMAKEHALDFLRQSVSEKFYKI